MKKIQNYSDESLLKLYIDTERTDYFAELYGRYISLLFAVCLRKLQNRDEAVDVICELFELLLSDISRYEIQDFRIWIYCVTENYCCQILKKEKRQIIPCVDSELSEVKESDEDLLLIENKYDNEISLLKKKIIYKSNFNRKQIRKIPWKSWILAAGILWILSLIGYCTEKNIYQP